MKKVNQLILSKPGKPQIKIMPRPNPLNSLFKTVTHRSLQAEDMGYETFSDSHGQTSVRIQNIASGTEIEIPANHLKGLQDLVNIAVRQNKAPVEKEKFTKEFDEVAAVLNGRSKDGEAENASTVDADEIVAEEPRTDEAAVEEPSDPTASRRRRAA